MLRRALVVTAALVVGHVIAASTGEPSAQATPALAVDHPQTASDGAPNRGRARQSDRAPATPADTPSATDRAEQATGHLLTPVGTSEDDPLGWSEERLTRTLDGDLPKVGSLSLGRPNAGALVNGVQMPAGDGWEVVDPGRAWGTQETVEYIERALAKLHVDVPDAPTVFVGHLSREKGGPLGPHRSHQSGRDVDLSYICKPGMNLWYQRASARTLDVARSWALVRALVTETDVEVMFIDLGVQKLLKEHALAIGEDPQWIDSLFRYKSNHPEPLIRHAWGHASHVHVRFYSPRAQALGIRSYEKLGALGVISPRTKVVRYQARPGDTLAGLAKRAGTNAAVIQKFNAGNAAHLEAGKTYLVPVRGQVADVRTLTVPPRRLPPPTEAAVAASPAPGGISGSRRASPSP